MVLTSLQRQEWYILKFKLKYLWGISSIMSPRMPETEMSTKIHPSTNAAASADW